MKKTFFSIALSAILILSFVFVACNRHTKEIQPSENATKQNVRQNKNGTNTPYVAENRLCFPDSITFVNTMTSLYIKNDTELLAFLSLYDFAAFKEGRDITKTDSLGYPDEMLTYVLNTDEIVQIADWVYKIDMQTQKVYAVKSSEGRDENALLNQKLPVNGLVHVFETSEEVLDLTYPIDNPQVDGEKRRRCRDGCAAGREKEKSFQQSSYDWRFKCKVVYQVAGIWKTLFAKMISQKKGAFGWYDYTNNIERRTLSDYDIKPRCENNQNFVNMQTTVSNQLRAVYYHSTRCLHTYKLKTTFYEFISVWNGTSTAPTPGNYTYIPSELVTLEIQS